LERHGRRDPPLHGRTDARRLRPQADGSFASYDVRTGTTVRLTFEGTDLVAKTMAGVVKARRVE